MELYKELLIQILKEEDIRVSFESSQINLNELIESRCYQILCEIKNIVEDDALDDSDCFLRIEEIVSAFEKAGSSGGFRHDFG